MRGAHILKTRHLKFSNIEDDLIYNIFRDSIHEFSSGTNTKLRQ